MGNRHIEKDRRKGEVVIELQEGESFEQAITRGIAAAHLAGRQRFRFYFEDQRRFILLNWPLSQMLQACSGPSKIQRLKAEREAQREMHA